MKTNNSMSTSTKPGNKVIFSFPDAGYDSDIELAKEYLVLGERYTIKSIRVDKFYTDIILKEVPDIIFNSIQFKNVRERK